MNREQPTIFNKFKQNTADFIAKHAMNVATGIYIGINFVYLGQNFTNHEEANIFRNIAAPLIQLPTNYLMYKAGKVKDDEAKKAQKRKNAYDVSVFGSSMHFSAAVSQGYWPHMIIWSTFAQAAYKSSNWPERVYTISRLGGKAYRSSGFGESVEKISNFTRECYKNSPLAKPFSNMMAYAQEKYDHWPQTVNKITSYFKKDELENPETNAIDEAASSKNRIGTFIDNKLGLLKDGHARAGCIALGSSLFLAWDAIYRHNHALTETSMISMVAATCYALHGLVTAHQKKYKV